LKCCTRILGSSVPRDKRRIHRGAIGPVRSREKGHRAAQKRWQKVQRLRDPRRGEKWTSDRGGFERGRKEGGSLRSNWIRRDAANRPQTQGVGVEKKENSRYSLRLEGGRSNGQKTLSCGRKRSGCKKKKKKPNTKIRGSIGQRPSQRGKGRKPSLDRGGDNSIRKFQWKTEGKYEFRHQRSQKKGNMVAG